MLKLNRCLIITLLAVFAAVSLLGCSGTGQPASTNDSETSGDPTELSQSGESLMVYSGAGLRKPMDEIGQVFEEKFNVTIEYSYAGSAQNLSQIELTGKGDAWTPGALFYAEAAVEKDLIKNMETIAYHIPVIAVPKGNPAGIEKLEDLAQPGVKVALGDAKACAIGKIAKKLFEENELTEKIAENIETTTPTVNELIVYTSMQQVDAVIIWEDNVVGVEDIEIVPINPEKNIIKTIPVCALNSSKKPELAQQFADFVAGPEGKAIYQKHGFKTVD